MTVPEILLKSFVSYWQAFLDEDKAHFPALIFATECQPVGAGRDEMTVISNLVVTHLELYRHSRRNAMYSQALHEVLRELEGSDFVTREAFVRKAQERLQPQWGARAGELGSVLFDRMVRGIYRLENQQDHLEFLKNENIVHRKLVKVDSRISWVPRVSRAQVNLFCAPQRHRVWRRLNRLQDALDHAPRADKVARSFRKPSASIQSFKENWTETDLPLDFFNQFVHKVRDGPLDAPVCRDVWENVLAKLQDMDIIPPQLATNRRVTRIITEGESQTPELDLDQTFKKAKAQAGHLLAPVEHMEIPGLKPAKRDEETPSFQGLHMDAIRSPALDTRFFRDGYKSCVEFSLITGKPLSTVVELAEIVVQEGIDKHAPILGYEEISLLAADLEVEIQWEGQLVDQWRPPVVTVMGHVDHGKTTILDFFRGTRTVEDGGITQKIGAFSVPTSKPILDGSEDLEYDDLLTSQFPFICFVDTPGHAAFRNMRMGGANIMDIILLVVAAEDGAQPQTLEALELAVQAKVPIVLCVNKVDQLDASEYDAACQTVLDSLEAHAYPVTLFSAVIPISGKQGINMSLLRRTILDVASGMETLKLPAQEIVDYQQLAASRLKRQISPQVHVLEYLNSDLGPLISGIVISGELRESDAFCLGHRSGKVRTMPTEGGKPLKRALPSMPVSLACQWTSDKPVDVTKGDKLEIFWEGPLAAQLEAKRRAAIFKSDLTDAQPEGTIGTVSGQHVNLILKADCEGSLVAMSTWIKENYGEAFRVVDQSVGKITPADVNLLVDSQAFLLAFNSPLVDPTLEAPPGAIREYTVIYRMFEECKLIFDFHFSDWYLWDRKCRVKIYKKGQYAQKRIVKDVAGFKVLEGNLNTNLYFDVLRDSVVVATKRQIDSIMVGSQAVSEVAKGGEAGVIFDESYADFEEGDEVLGYSRRIRDPLFGSFASRRFGT